MKATFYFVLAVFSVTADISVAKPEQSQNDDLIDDVKMMEEQYNPWLPSVGHPHRRVSFVFPDTLPEAIRKRGFTGGTIEVGFVILWSSNRNAAIAEGISISTDGEDHSESLEILGWEVTVSDDPRIICLKQNKQNKAEEPTPNPPSD